VTLLFQDVSALKKRKLLSIEGIEALSTYIDGDAFFFM